MKKILIYISIIGIFFYGCNSSITTIKNTREESITLVKNDTIHLKNDQLEYDIIIFEPGFENWLLTQPPKGYFGIEYLENKNRFWVAEYNRRVYDLKYSRKLYEQEINYDPNIHYGLEVNYLLYNYLKYFQEKFKQKF